MFRKMILGLLIGVALAQETIKVGDVIDVGMSGRVPDSLMLVDDSNKFRISCLVEYPGKLKVLLVEEDKLLMVYENKDASMGDLWSWFQTFNATS